MFPFKLHYSFIKEVSIFSQNFPQEPPTNYVLDVQTRFATGLFSRSEIIKKFSLIAEPSCHKIQFPEQFSSNINSE